MIEDLAVASVRTAERLVHNRPLRVAALLAVLISALAAGFARGLGIFLLIVAGCMLLLVIALLWNSLQSLTDENTMTLQEALALGRPSPEEERKRAVLRALKDLEYERSVGKISENDYAELAARYRQEAKELLRVLDQDLSPFRQQVQVELDKRLAAENHRRRARKSERKRSRANAEPGAHDAGEESPTSDALISPASADVERETARTAPAPQAAAGVKRPTRRCKACDTRNDLDAHFCKRCGQALAGPQQVLCSTCPAVFSADLDECPECGLPRDSA